MFWEGFEPSRSLFGTFVSQLGYLSHFLTGSFDRIERVIILIVHVISTIYISISVFEPYETLLGCSDKKVLPFIPSPGGSIFSCRVQGGAARC